MGEIAYIDGQFVPIQEAKVSIEDRGFVFADGVYEVIVAYGGRPFRLAQHLARLKTSAEAIRLALPSDAGAMEKIIQEGIRQSGFADAKIYLQVTRGVAPRAHPFPGGARPTFVATFRRKTEVPTETRQKGVRAITTEDVRWAKCYIKSIALLPNVLASQKAAEAGAAEAIFVTPEGVVHEGAASNVFIVEEKKVYTPPKTEKILHGITREAVLEAARKAGHQTLEQTIMVDRLLRADELFLTGTTIEVLGVVKVDDQPIGSGAVGAVTKSIYQKFRELIRS